MTEVTGKEHWTTKKTTDGDVRGFAMILQAAGVATLREQTDGEILIVAAK